MIPPFAFAFVSFHFALALSLFSVGVNAQGSRPTGLNCNLAAPPNSAGELGTNDDFIERIYPRAGKIDSKYTGCQATLVWTKGKWTTTSLVAIEKGEPTRIWAPQTSNPELLACQYKNGKVVSGDASKCVPAGALISISIAPGCAAKVRRATADGGPDAPTPEGCKYDRYVPPPQTCNKVSLAESAVHTIAIAAAEREGYKIDKSNVQVKVGRERCDYFVNVTYDPTRPGGHVSITLAESGEVKEVRAGY